MSLKATIIMSLYGLIVTLGFIYGMIYLINWSSVTKPLKKRLVEEILENPKTGKAVETEINRIRNRFKSHVNMNVWERFKFLFQGSKYYDN